MSKSVLIVGGLLLALGTPLAAQKTEPAAPPLAGSEAEVRQRADAMFEEAHAHYLAGRQAEAIAGLRARAEAVEAALGPDHQMTVDAIGVHGVILENLGHYADSEEVFRGLLDRLVAARGESDSASLVVLGNVGRVVHKQGRLAEAEELLARALALTRAAFGPETPETLAALDNYSGLLRDLGRVQEASAMMAEAAALSQQLTGPASEQTLQAQASYAISLHTLGRSREAAERLAQLLPAIEATFGEARPTTHTVMGSYAQVLLALGRLEEAEQWQRRELQLAQQLYGTDAPQRIQALGNYAVTLRSLRRMDEARALLEQAVTGYREVYGVDHPQTLFAQQNLGVLYQDIGEMGQALLLFEDTLAALRRVSGDRHPRTLLAINNLAAVQLRLGLFAESAVLLREAYDGSLAVNGEAHPDTAQFLANLAVALEGLGDADQAGRAHSHTFELRMQHLGPSHPDTLLGASNFAHFLLNSSERPELAFGPARLAVRGWRERRDRLGDDPRSAAQRARGQSSQDYYLETLLDAAWAAAAFVPANEPEFRAEVLATMQDMLAGSTTSAIARSAARRAAEVESAEASALVAERQELDERWLASEQALTAALGDASEAGAARREALRAELGAMERRLAQLDALLQDAAPQYFAFARPQAQTLEQAQAMLAPDEAVLMVVPTALGSHVLAISSDSVQWHRSEWNRTAVDAAVRRLQYDLGYTSAATMAEGLRWSEENEDRGPLAFDFASAHALYRELVEPVDDVLAGKAHVFVLNSGVLTGLPLGLLVSELPAEGGDAAETLRDAAWLADRHALVTVPSLQSIALLRASAAAGEAEQVPFIGFGNPVLGAAADERGAGRGPGDFGRLFAPGQARGERGVASAEAIRAMASLPGTERELQALWRAFGQPPNALFLADAASESAVKAADLDAAVIVFATHGLLAGQLGGLAEPGLVLTPPAEASAEDDGYLSMSEVAELQIDADWVILSACNTAGGDGGEDSSGLSGLARAFFYAGARNLLVSHWPVLDDVAAELTVRTVALARDNPQLSRAQAFQQAMAEIRHDPAHPDWAHPLAWAPFVLVGDR